MKALNVEPANKDEVRRLLRNLLAILFTLVVCGSSSLLWVNLRMRVIQVELEHEISEEVIAQELEVDLLEMQGMLHQYLQTGQAEYLDIFMENQSSFRAHLEEYNSVAKGSPDEEAWANRLKILGDRADAISDKLCNLYEHERTDFAELRSLFTRTEHLLDEQLQPAQQDDFHWLSIIREIKINLKNIVLNLSSYLATPAPALRVEVEDSLNDLQLQLAEFDRLANTPEEREWFNRLRDTTARFERLGAGLLEVQDEQEKLFTEYRFILHQISHEVLDTAIQPEAQSTRLKLISRVNGLFRISWQVGLLGGSLGVLLTLFYGLMLTRRVVGLYEDTLASEARFRSLFDDNPAIYFIADVRGVLLSVNPFGAAYLGYTPEELLGRLVYHLFHEEDRAAALAFIGKCATEPGVVFESELRQIHRDGLTWFWMHGIARAVKSANGEISVMIICDDITPRKQAELERDLRLIELETVQRISHRLRHTETSDEMLNAVLDETLEALKTDSGSIWLYEPAGEELRKVAWRGWSADVNVPVLKPGEGIVGFVYQTGEPYFIQDYASDPHAHPETREQMPPGWGGVCIPITFNTHPLGILFISVKLPRQVELREVNLLVLISQFTGNALQRMRLHEQTLKDMIELGTAYQSLIETWSRALDLRDHETEGHTQRVTQMTLQLARPMGIPEDELGNLYRGALLHDIGKIGIPDSVLLKRGKLTEDEWKIMRLHPQIARDNLIANPYLKSALDIPYCHHEKWDGTGYPRGLRAEEIPLAARIFAVVDVWDALTSDRPYRAAIPEEEALQYIRQQSDKSFDPRVVDVFLKLVESKHVVVSSI